MPSKSPEQAALMRAACHNPKIARKRGIPVGVACEFFRADQAKKKRLKKRGKS